MNQTDTAPVVQEDALPVKPPRKKRSKKKMILLGIVLLAVVAVVAGRIKTAITGPAALPVATENVQPGDIDQTLSTSGSLLSGNKVTVYAPVGAPVEALAVHQGQQVSAGDALVSFDTADLSRAVRTAQAQAASGRLQAQESLQNSDASQQKFNDAAANLQNVAVQKDNAAAKVAQLTEQYASFTDTTTPEAVEAKGRLDAATADLSAMETALQAAKASYDAAKTGVLSDGQKQQLSYGQVAGQVTLEAAQEDLEAGKAGVSAPISGVITSLTADTGAMLAAGSPVCVIEGLDDVQVDIALSRYDLEKVSVGQSAVVSVLGKDYTGTLISIDGMATTATTTTGTASYVHARIRLDTPDNDLKLGLDANVKLDTGSASGVLTVPISAVNTDTQGQFCYVVEAGRAVRRTIATGLSNDTRVQVTEGLSAGDVVITEPAGVMADMAVAAQPTDTSASAQDTNTVTTAATAG